MRISVKVDVSRAMRLVGQNLPRAVPYVKASLLTGLAQQVRAGVVKQLPVAFDRPTDFTLRGVYTKPATKTAPTAVVYFPESHAASGKSKREYIRPGAQGSSARAQKRSELLLTRAGVLPAGWVTVPGRFAMQSLLDGNGNMKGTYYRQIIRNLQLKATAARAARPIAPGSVKRAARMGVENEFFAVAPGRNALAKGGGWLPPGVYRRTGARGQVLQQYLKFVRKASYQRRLDMAEVANKVVPGVLQAEFGKAFASVVRKFAARGGVV